MILKGEDNRDEIEGYPIIKEENIQINNSNNIKINHYIYIIYKKLVKNLQGIMLSIKNILRFRFRFLMKNE